MKRRRRTIEQSVEAAVRYARVMDDVPYQIEFHERMAGLSRGTVRAYEALSAMATGRGDKWSATYHLRRAKERLAEYEAIVAALRQMGA